MTVKIIETNINVTNEISLSIKYENGYYKPSTDISFQSRIIEVDSWFKYIEEYISIH